MNLIRMSEDDDNLLIDIFLYDSKGNILANSVPLGHRMHGFQSRQTGKSFPALSILTERELVVGQAGKIFHDRKGRGQRDLLDGARRGSGRALHTSKGLVKNGNHRSGRKVLVHPIGTRGLHRQGRSHSG